MDMKRDVALVLSCGGARGIAHIGIIEELEKDGFNIHAIAGSSIGAAVGGIYAAGNLKEYADWMCELGKMDVIKLMDFAISKKGFIKGERVFKKIRHFIGDHNIEDLPIPYAAIASDIINLKEIVFTQGKLIDAIRASVSVPTLLLPYILDGVDLVDGGMLNPLPLNRVERKENDLLVAVNLNAAIPYDKPQSIETVENNESYYLKAREALNRRWSKYFNNDKEKDKGLGFFDLLIGSFALMQNKISSLAIEKYNPDIVINISRDACDTLEFYKAAELIEYGREAYRKSIADRIND